LPIVCFLRVTSLSARRAELGRNLSWISIIEGFLTDKRGVELSEEVFFTKRGAKCRAWVCMGLPALSSVRNFANPLTKKP
jgi:hypothetical protein